MNQKNSSKTSSSPIIGLQLKGQPQVQERTQPDFNVEFRCGRCGKKERCRESKLTHLDLPPGWERASGVDLCPECWP